MLDTRIPYDKSTVIWSPEGELVQLTYARRASERGQPAIGLILNDTTMLLAGRTRVDELVEKQSKIKEVEKSLYFLPSGLISDSNYLLSQARLLSQKHTLVYGEVIGPEALAKQLGDLMARHTITGGLRAFGASILLAGFEPYSKKPKILFVDNGGSYISAKAHASGQDSGKIVTYLREHYKMGLSVEQGEKIVLEAINFTLLDQSQKLEAKDVDFQIVKPIDEESW